MSDAKWAALEMVVQVCRPSSGRSVGRFPWWPRPVTCQTETSEMVTRCWGMECSKVQSR